jgi:hypothetical protein
MARHATQGWRCWSQSLAYRGASPSRAMSGAFLKFLPPQYDTRKQLPLRMRPKPLRRYHGRRRSVHRHCRRHKLFRIPTSVVTDASSSDEAVNPEAGTLRPCRPYHRSNGRRDGWCRIGSPHAPSLAACRPDCHIGAYPIPAHRLPNGCRFVASHTTSMRLRSGSVIQPLALNELPWVR